MQDVMYAKKCIPSSESVHEQRKKKLLLIRNLAVIVVALFFIVSSFVPGFTPETISLLRALAYFLGAVAYLLEIAALTDAFRSFPPLREMFMPYVMGLLYVMLAFVHLME